MPGQMELLDQLAVFLVRWLFCSDKLLLTSNKCYYIMRITNQSDPVVCPVRICFKKGGNHHDIRENI